MSLVTSPRLRILSVGGNAVSAFLSWRLQATNACDVTLVWKNSFETVSQYGISFKSKQYGNERFKPRAVVRTPEEAAATAGGYDYVLLCVKALPDVYDIAAVIESVVMPQHTCILVNTSNSLGIEPYLETRYPSNVILSLVSGANINQLAPSEFEHLGNSDVWVGSTIKNSTNSNRVQMDMAEAFALTLVSANVDCHVSPNIRQQQWERMVGPIAFHPLSVMLETPNHAVMLEKPGIKKLVDGIADELIAIATAQGCEFSADFKQKTLEAMLQPSVHNSVMFHDFMARRPIEIEVYLGSPIKMAQLVGLEAPHCETLYGILHHINQANQSKTANASSPPTSPPLVSPAPTSPHPPPRPINQRAQLNIKGRPPLHGSHLGLPSPPGPGRRVPPMSNGITNGNYQNGYLPRTGLSRKNSFENDLEEFSHIAMYNDIIESDDVGLSQTGMVNGDASSDYGRRVPSNSDLVLREKELALRQREIELRERELNLGRVGVGSGRAGRRKSRTAYDDDDDDDEVYFDNGMPPPIDPGSIDMMSVTSRRTRRLPSTGNLKGLDTGIIPSPRSRSAMASGRPSTARDRISARIVSGIPTLHENLLDNPLMGYSSNRYGAVDRKMLHDSSRANSLSGPRPSDIRDDPAFVGLGQRGGGPYPPQRPGPPPPPPGMRLNGMPGAPPNGYSARGAPTGAPNSPMARQLLTPSNRGEQHLPDAVSHSRPIKGPPSNANRSTTGSASASNDSGSGTSQLDETSGHPAYSSSSSLEKSSGRYMG